MEREPNSLRAAAAPTLARLRRDQERAPLELATALDHVASHLFAPDLDVAQMRRATPIAGRELNVLFREHLGTTPRGYIEECRMSIGGRLLTQTDLPMGQIGELLGYSSAPVFSRAFVRFWGERPSVYRQRARREAARQAVYRILEAIENRDGVAIAAALEPFERALELTRELGDRTLYSRLLVARAALAGPVGKKRHPELLAQVRALVAD